MTDWYLFQTQSVVRAVDPVEKADDVKSSETDLSVNFDLQRDRKQTAVEWQSGQNIASRKPPPIKAEPKYRVDLVDLIKNGTTLRFFFCKLFCKWNWGIYFVPSHSKVQARTAFAAYLTRVQQRLLVESHAFDNSNEDRQSANQQMVVLKMFSDIFCNRNNRLRILSCVSSSVPAAIYRRTFASPYRADGCRWTSAVVCWQNSCASLSISTISRLLRSPMKRRRRFRIRISDSLQSMLGFYFLPRRPRSTSFFNLFFATQWNRFRRGADNLHEGAQNGRHFSRQQ